jgi:hypothetical protein
MLLLIGILVLSNLLANYHNYIIVAPITFALIAIVTYLKYRVLKLVSVFEIVILVMYFVILMLSIFIPQINELHDSKITLLLFTGYWLLTWLINRPVAYVYVRHDYRTDYTRTKLFKSMSGGLTFIWGMLFLVIAALSFALPQSYASLGYYLAILGLYLTYYYPNSYIKGSIDKQTRR